MRMRAPAIVALGIAAYVVFLVATVPASFVIEKLNAPAVSEFSDVRGTLWNGSARALLRLPQGPISVERLEWKFRPARLIGGRLAFDVHAASTGMQARAELSRGFSGIEARDLLARAEAPALAAFAPLAAGWQPQGIVTIESPGVSWNDRELRGEGRAEWRGAALSLSEVRPLGSYRAEVRGTGGPAKVAITTIEGPLRLSGDGTFTPSGRLTFSGEARGEGAVAQKLDPLLDLLGPRRPDGARQVKWGQ
jgi:general secretion pathway protein N